MNPPDDTTSSPDAGPALDLRPRSAPAPRRRRGLAAFVVVGLLVLAGFVLWRGLANATLYFYNADEAVAQRDDLGDSRFRLQGTVVDGSVAEEPTGVRFEVTFNGVEVPVDHTGAPPDLFQEGMPVVVEGHWQGDVFASDEILVKHDEVYVEENGDRLREADEGGVEPRTDAPDTGGAGTGDDR